jgi:hypothetical protein
MANELTVTAGLRFAKGSGDAALSITQNLSNTVDVSGTEAGNSLIQVVGTSAEAMAAPSDVGTQGYVLLRNLDTTNFVTVSTDSAAHANPCVKLKAGEIAVFRANGALYLKADTAACRVEFTVIED